MNRLSREKSPYLLQHASNPIHWFSWGSEAFEESRKQNKPIFLSVGYSTCHWCHVMEHESFVDTEVADFLNAHFISVKVDREEHPHVDSLYMETVQAMSGSGGWPMTVFITPEGKPFFGGTYFPKVSFLHLLRNVQTLWQKDPDKIVAESEKILTWLQNAKAQALGGVLDKNIFTKFCQTFSDNFDHDNGGYLGHPKFPPSYALRMLLRCHSQTKNAAVLEMLTKTLDKMGRGGIYDHIGGGFHRYSTDEKWFAPHFEKMLYDQAALVHAYLEGYQVTREDEYRLVVREIIDYVLRDLTHPDGGFYSAEDADSEGSEGKFYVWTTGELNAVLTPQEFSALRSDFSFTEEGNFEDGTNILFLKETATRKNRSENLKSALAKLLSARAKRVRPLRDDKIISEWNGLFISALAKASLILKDDTYKAAAEDAGHFIWTHLRDSEGHLYRRWIKGEAKFFAGLADYAFVVDAFLELYQATGSVLWFERAELLQTIQDKLFWNAQGSYNDSAPDDLLIHQKKTFEDNVIPSGNSMSILNLLRLSSFSLKSDYSLRASALMKSFPEFVERYPSGFPQFLMGLDYFLSDKNEIVVAGGDLHTLRALAEPFFPNKILAISDNTLPPVAKSKPPREGEVTIYICSNNACREPLSLNAALNVLRS